MTTGRAHHGCARCCGVEDRKGKPEGGIRPDRQDSGARRLVDHDGPCGELEPPSGEAQDAEEENQDEAEGTALPPNPEDAEKGLPREPPRQGGPRGSQSNIPFHTRRRLLPAIRKATVKSSMIASESANPDCAPPCSVMRSALKSQ